MKKALFVVTLLLFWASFAFGQRDGVLSFTAADVHEFDTVNLVSLVPSFNIPLLAKSKGALPGSFGFVSSQSCWVKPNAGGTNYSTYCGANPNLADLAQFNFIPNSLMTLGTDAVAVYAGGVGMCYTTTAKHLIGADGLSSYSIPTTTISSQSGCTPSSATVTTNDGSGITATLTATGSGLTMSMTVSTIFDASGNTSTNSGSVSDPFSNSVTDGGTNPNLTFTDTLGAVTDYTVANGALDGSIKYTDTTGTQQTITMTNGAASTFQPLGSCGTLNTGNAVTPISSINFPDGTSFGFTWDTNSSGLDGLIKSITLPTGGTITYAYTLNSSACSGVWGYSALSRTTSDGTTNYSESVASGVQTTTVLDPGKNKTVYVFLLGSDTGTPRTMTVLQSKTNYQNTGTVASPTYTEISAKSYCYNTVCGGSTPPNYPITTYEIKSYLGSGPTFMSDETETLDSTYGLVLTDATTDEINSQTITTTYVYGTYSSGTCSAITNTNIVDHPCTVTTKNGTTWLSESTYTYNSNGALTSSSICLSSTCTGSSALTTNYTRNSTGTPATVTLPNSQLITNTFGSCNSLLLTDSTTTVNSVAIDNKQSWNCNAAVVTDTTDPNSNEDDYAYDSMNRLSSYTDRLENVTSYAYGTPTLDHVKVTDPLSVVSYVYNDGLGRPTNRQVCQTTGCSNLDTSSKSYAWNGTNFETKTYVPCVQTVLNTACTIVALTADDNPIVGPTLSTDANSGTLTYAVNSKDFSVTAGPAPSQENTKVIQTEIDGFGRITSTCALTSSGYNGRVSCGQTMGNSGILTSNAYSFDATTGAPKVVTTRGSQTHTTITDSIGRATTITTPEAGTVTNYYDSVSGTTCVSTPPAFAGGLIATKTNASDYICHSYDGLGRVTDTYNNYQNSSHPCLRTRYDSTANGNWTAPSDYPSSGANIVGRLVEAATDGCAANTLITDEWFAYDKDGRMTDMWEKTPNSSGFYHTTATYDADGMVTKLTGFPGTTYYFQWAGDGEDRPNSMGVYSGGTLSQTVVNSTGFVYDAASRPTTVPIGSTSGDQDTFSYDNVGNMTDYKFTINSKSDEGALTWNPIGSLNTLVITDGFNSGGSQTCKYGSASPAVEGYDDVGRLLDANCGSLIQHDSWTYDQYDNANRTGNPGTNWNSSYSSTNNQFTLTGATYDSNGNLTYDGVNSNSWGIYGQMVGTISGNHTVSCGSAGSYCATYDAFGRTVETSNGSTYSQILFTPIGKAAYMSGQSVSTFYVPAPGGGDFYMTGGTMYFLHPDWLGSKRLSTSLVGRAYYSDTAYTPYGESYDTFGNLPDFTGLTQDVASGLFTTPTRTLATNASRWLSPDPAHAGWNAYAYPTDPNTEIDPSGLRGCDKSDDACVIATPDPVAVTLSYYGMLYPSPLIYRHRRWQEGRLERGSVTSVNIPSVTTGPVTTIPSGAGTSIGDIGAALYMAWFGWTAHQNVRWWHMEDGTQLFRTPTVSGQDRANISYQQVQKIMKPVTDYREWEGIQQTKLNSYAAYSHDKYFMISVDDALKQGGAIQEVTAVTRLYSFANVLSLTLPMNGSHQSWIGEKQWTGQYGGPAILWTQLKAAAHISWAVGSQVFHVNTWPF